MDARAKTGMCKTCYSAFRSANKKPKRKSGNQYKRFGKTHYQRNKKYYYEKAMARKRHLRELVDNYKKSHPCVDCGNPDYRLLTFDHINDDKEIDVSKIVNRGWSDERLMKEISKCEVVCSNDHAIRTWERRQKLLSDTGV